MAHYANGQEPYGRHDHGSASPQSLQPSAAHGRPLPYPVGQEHLMSRIPSYEPGDDGQSAADRDDYDMRQAGVLPESHSGDGLGGGYSPSINQGSSYSPALSGYRHQYQGPASPPIQAPYNPQLFARVQSQYNPSNQHNGRGAYSGGHQPYNPALYGGPSSPNSLMVARVSPRLDQHGFAAQLNQGPGSVSSQYRPWNQPGRPTAQNSAHEPRRSDQFPSPLPSPQIGADFSPRPSIYSPPPPPPPPIPPGLATPISASENGFSPTHQTVHGLSIRTPYPETSRLDPRPLQSHVLPPPPDSEEQDGSETYDGPTTRYSPSPVQNVTHPLPPPPGPGPPQHSQMSTRHPQARPLPGPPIDPDLDDDQIGAPQTGVESELTDEELAHESIWREVEAAVMNSASSLSSDPRPPLRERPRPIGMTRWGGAAPLLPQGQDQSAGFPNELHTNGNPTLTESNQYTFDDAYKDDSDPEAAAGLAAMRLADEQEAANDARRESGQAPVLGTYPSRHSSYQDDPVENSSDSDYANFDMGLYGGGYEGHVSYSNGHFNELEGRAPSLSTPQSAPISDRPALGHLRMPSEPSVSDQDAAQPFSAVHGAARVDISRTGGLADPAYLGRRRSFEEDDERSWGDRDDRQSGSQSPSKDDFPEMFYHPGMHSSSSDRPLPQIPPPWSNGIPHLKATAPSEGSVQYQQHNDRVQRVLNADTQHPNQLISPTSLAVPRSSSLSNHSNTPQAIPPVRSKTDAEERKAKLLKHQPLGIYSTAFGSEVSLDSAVAQGAVPLDLPAIPAGKRKRFNPAKLSTADFKKCSEPWALSSIAAWVKDLSEDETDLKETTVVNGIVSLFTHKVPTMNIADAEMLSIRVVQEMFATGALVHDEEWVKFGSETVTGVIWQLTCSGCYAPRLHGQDMPGRCYAHHCSRTLKKVNLQAHVLEPRRKLEDWATFYKVKKEDIEHAHRKEVERQNILHEIVQGEDQYMDGLNVLLVLYREQLLSSQPSIIQPSRIGKFVKDVFGKVDAVKKVNEDYLLAQIKYRQQEQGPWIIGFSDIFREWIRKARDAYIEYAANFPQASLLIRKEAERNILFRQFLDAVRENERSKRLGWDTYLKAPITRLQHYGLLLSTVLKNSVQETEEKANLQIAIDEIKVVTHECDARVAEMSKKVDLAELGTKLLLRPGLQSDELNLDHLGRELIFEGDLQRTGANRFTWLETHAILFDHYLVLAKTIHQKGSTGGLRQEKFDVSKRPISMDLLVLESINDDPVVKSSVKGIGAVTTVTTKAQSSADPRHTRTASNQGPGPGTLTQTSTSTSITSIGTVASGKGMVTTTVLESPKDEKTMYPFRIRHLGQDVYTLYAPTAQNRQDWCEKILEAKTRRAASLHTQNAEPFRLRVIADTAFAYDAPSGGPKGTVIKGTPLDRAIRDVENLFENAGPRPGPICRAAVNCATAFTQPYGKNMVAIGTDYGVYVSDADNPRGWNRAISVARVTQIAVLEEFSLFLLIADKSLIAYHLDIVCPVSGLPPRSDSLTKAPQKLSGNREVGFFATGRMKDRTLVFYKKGGGLSSTFKVLEPVFHKATEKKSRFSRKGTTEFFREFDEFYIPAECFGINVFRSYLANSTARGFEVLNLDKKQGYAVPDLTQPHVTSIAARLSSQKPLGMFRLNDAEFLLCYEECAVYANKHGDVSRSVVMEYIDKAKSAAIYGPYVLLFGTDYVEIRNAENGRLRQVIAGKDIKCLDDAQTGGSAGNRTIKVTLQHPEMERTQLVLELILNEGQRD